MPRCRATSPTSSWAAVSASDHERRGASAPTLRDSEVTAHPYAAVGWTRDGPATMAPTSSSATPSPGVQVRPPLPAFTPRVTRYSPPGPVPGKGGGERRRRPSECGSQRPQPDSCWVGHGRGRRSGWRRSARVAGPGQRWPRRPSVPWLSTARGAPIRGHDRFARLTVGVRSEENGAPCKIRTCNLRIRSGTQQLK